APRRRRPDGAQRARWRCVRGMCRVVHLPRQRSWTAPNRLRSGTSHTAGSRCRSDVHAVASPGRLLVGSESAPSHIRAVQAHCAGGAADRDPPPLARTAARDPCRRRPLGAGERDLSFDLPSKAVSERLQRLLAGGLPRANGARKPPSRPSRTGCPLTHDRSPATPRAHGRLSTRATGGLAVLGRANHRRKTDARRPGRPRPTLRGPRPGGVPRLLCRPEPNRCAPVAPRSRFAPVGEHVARASTRGHAPTRNTYDAPDWVWGGPARPRVSPD